MKQGKVYLIPTVLEENALDTIPVYIVDAIKDCSIFFVETEKTTRRFFKKVWKEMIIDDYTWHTIHKAEALVQQAFINALKSGNNVGIISDAGCPGIADPGQLLIEVAQQNNIIVHPLVGPSSILLALMASGMNGQNFQFHGYLPIDSLEKKKKIKELEAASEKNKTTQIFIETPYRNNQLLNDLLQACKPTTHICIAVNITSETESIRTKQAKDWMNQLPELHKIPVVFLIQA